jgi:superfamily I DNA/RNA helicase
MSHNLLRLQRYEALLRANNAMDFDDILPLAVAILKHCPEVLQRYQQRWRHVLVDEFQDTNAGQYDFVRLLSSEGGELFVVGDPDQSIYSWRGADVLNMVENMGSDFPNVATLRLMDNYRCAPSFDWEVM